MGKDSKLISVIIPTYNRKDLVIRCIKSILKQDYNNFEIIVVDDGSTDNTSEVIRTIFPFVKIEANQQNRGVIYSKNRGAEVAKGEILFFIDNDTFTEEQNIFSKAVKTFEEFKDVACIALRISDPVDRNYTRPPFPKRDKQRMKKVFERFEVTNFVGTGVFIRRNAFQDVGGYFYIDPCGGKEETDLSLRFIKRGYKIYYAGDMTVYHGLDQPNPFHFNWKSKYRAGLSNSFIIAARYLPFPYFLTYTFIWTLYYLYQYHKKKLLIHFGKDFTYALQNFIQIWRSERSKHKLDKITVNKIRRLKGRLAY